jgi:peptidyl-prolyl cis-trans isomerase C
MSPLSKTAASVCVAALLIAAGTLAVRAQDGTAEPPPAAEAPATEAPAEAAPAEDAGTVETPAPEAAAEAETPRNPDDIVARVGDQTITEREITVAAEQFSGELAQVPEAERRSVLIDAVVSVKLLAQAAREEGLDQTDEFKARLAFNAEQALRNEYIERNIVPSLTDEEVQQGYQDLVVSQHQPQEEVRARHILVATEDEAKAIIEQLKNGTSFEELATQSLDQTGQSGGDLGFFGRGQMVPQFEEVAFKLQKGEVGEPFQTQLGWHVIRVDDRRQSAAPPFEAVKDRVVAALIHRKAQQIAGDLRGKAQIEYIDPEIKSSVDGERSGRPKQ